MYTSVLVQIFFVVLAATTALAVWKGDTAVKWGAGIHVALNVVAIPAIQHAIAGDAGEVALVIEDLLGSIGFLLLAVRFANWWVGAIMLVQSGQFALHSYYLVMELPHDKLHAWLTNSGDWIIILCLLAGTIAAWRRRVALAHEAAELEARRNQRLSATS